MARERKADISRRATHTDLDRRVVIKTEDDLLDIIGGLSEPALILILDSVQDPHNLGACLRVADAAGAHAVVVPKDRAATLTPAVRQVASGAAEKITFVQVTNLAGALERLKEVGLWIVGTADAATQSIYDIDFITPTALVMGSEGKGLRKLVAEKCDFLVSIPMLGSVECLNVSVAAGVCLFEAVRQRLKPSL
ncbi:MAG: 23S rRNA (guanosine(2251)-2'-O)-methyltransferase RlmB [Candidatus Zixiibacteriota bacterium]|nr:MAG: 23S rRNA (guanosine(2251)-2'-O)-methyltransferase RlmB [candidate division Zixibacteria bacterium]